MKPAPFAYHSPETLEEVVHLLRSLEDARVLAGGQSLVPMMALRLTHVRHLVDLRRVDDLAAVRHEDGYVHVGAMVRHARFESDERSCRLAPLLAAATHFVGHFQIRNRGTIGGSIAHADPAAEYPAAALALDAEFDAVSLRGARVITAGEFFQGMWTTALSHDEVLTGLRFTPWEERSAFAVDEVARRHGDFALAGAACGVQVGGSGEVVRAAVALFGIQGTPVRATTAELSLIGGVLNDAAIDAASDLALHGLDPTEDIHASSAHRARLVPVVVGRALRKAAMSIERGPQRGS